MRQPLVSFLKFLAFEPSLAFGIKRCQRRPVEARQFLQMHGTYRVRGRVGGRDIAFDAPGAAETFR